MHSRGRDPQGPPDHVRSLAQLRARTQDCLLVLLRKSFGNVQLDADRGHTVQLRIADRVKSHPQALRRKAAFLAEANRVIAGARGDRRQKEVEGSHRRVGSACEHRLVGGDCVPVRGRRDEQASGERHFNAHRDLRRC